MRFLKVDELLGAVVAYGQKEAGEKLNEFDNHLAFNAQWQDMDKRVQFLDEERIDLQVLFPTLGLLWEGTVNDPELAAAHCRAYNTSAFELCAGHRDRLFPMAHISLRNPQLAAPELERVAKLGCRGFMLGSAPVNGRSFGHPDFDSVWAAAQDLNLGVAIHPAGNPDYIGSAWYRDRDPGFMFVTMNVVQDPRMALTTMVHDGVFERFPRLRVATVEAMVGWVGEWLERLDYRFKYMKHTSQTKRPATEYFHRNIWVNADPEENMCPLIVQFAGDDKFFIGSDYPHAEGFVHPVRKAREMLSIVPTASVDKILGTNARAFYGI